MLGAVLVLVVVYIVFLAIPTFFVWLGGGKD